MNFIAFVVSVMLLIVHISLGIGVYSDAKKLDDTGSVLFAWPIVWCFSTFIGGVFAAAAYWLLHHSVLNPQIAHTALMLRDAKEKPTHVVDEMNGSGTSVSDDDVAQYLDRDDRDS